MSYEPPPANQPGPLSFQRYGCLVVLAIFVGLIVGAVLLARHVVVGTAVPFRVLAAMIEKVNPNVKIDGISGDLTTGPSVKSITWGSDPANPSQILDLRAKYNGYSDAKKKKQIVITDVGVRKAHIDLADFGPVTRTTTTSTGTTTSRGPVSSASGSSSPAVNELGVESVEIKQVLIEDVLITNRNSDFRLSIPKVSWTGFKVTKDTVEPGELVVESDRVTLHTIPGRTLPVGKESVTFQKTLEGVLQPLLHESILQPIRFKLDYSFVPELKTPAFHFETAEGKVEIVTTGEGGHTLSVRGVDLAAYFDAKKLYGSEAADFPANVVLEATTEADSETWKIVSGSFLLGVTKFEIVAGEFSASGDSGLNAVVRTGAGEIRWTLPLKDFPIQCRPVFSSTPEMEPKEILARVFAGKKYAELTEEEKKTVDAWMPVYFSGPER